MKTIFGTLPLLLLAALNGACADCLTYFGDRGRDLLDVVRIEVGAGTGMHVNAQATRFVQLGGGWIENGGKLGLKGHQDGLDFYKNIRQWGVWRFRKQEINALIPLYSKSFEDPIAGETAYLLYGYEGLDFPDAPYSIYDPSKRPGEFGLDVHLVFFGAGIGIDPLSLADFVCGIVGIDFQQDDEVNTIADRDRYREIYVWTIEKIRRIAEQYAVEPEELAHRITGRFYYHGFSTDALRDVIYILDDAYPDYARVLCGFLSSITPAAVPTDSRDAWIIWFRSRRSQLIWDTRVKSFVTFRAETLAPQADPPPGVK